MVRVVSLTSLAAVVVVALLSACGAEPSPTPVPSTATPAATATASVAQPSGGSTVATAVSGIAPTPTSAPQVDITQMGSKSLFILHTNDVIGYTDPCG